MYFNVDACARGLDQIEAIRSAAVDQWDMLCRLGYALTRDRHRALDVAQEAVLRALAHPERLRRNAPVEAYLRGLARNAARALRTRATREVPVDFDQVSDTLQPRSRDGPVDEVVLQREEASRLRAAVSRLTRAQERAVERVDLAEETLGQAARGLSAGRSSVSEARQRALVELRRALRDPNS